MVLSEQLLPKFKQVLKFAPMELRLIFSKSQPGAIFYLKKNT